VNFESFIVALRSWKTVKNIARKTSWTHFTLFLATFPVFREFCPFSEYFFLPYTALDEWQNGFIPIPINSDLLRTMPLTR
jgi:hypothetical protein